MNDILIWGFILSHLKKNNPVILTSVLHHEKGSPGKQGFKMAVSKSGDMTGSIGGGIMEFNTINRSKKYFDSNWIPEGIEILHHNKKKSSNRSGLICSGSQTNFTILLKKNHIRTVSSILNSLKKNINGEIVFHNKGFNFIKGKEEKEKYTFRFKSDSDWRYTENTGTTDTVVIAGCGHVGLAVSRQMSFLGFKVIAYDDRKSLSMIAKNIFADKIVIDSFNKFGKLAGKNPDAFFVVATTGFESDRQALISILNMNVRYIGLMGTMSKIKKIFHEIVKSGIERKLLKKVHAPIGIDIESNTPEEIAVSIAAEIIKEKNSC